MGRVRACGAVLGVAVVLGCLTGANAWAGTGLLKTAAGSLGPGALLQLRSSDLTLSSPVGNVECETAILAGTLNGNSGSSAKATVSESTTSGCHVGLSSATLKFTGLPWSAGFTAKGLLEIKGVVGVQIEYPAAGLECAGTTAKGLIGSFGKSGPVDPMFTEVPVKLVTGKGECPPEGKLGGTFAMTSAGETVEVAGSQGGGGAGTGAVEGTVTGTGNAPVAGVSVSVCEEEEPVTCYAATTDGSGHYSISGLPEGEYVATATPPAHDDYGPAESEEFAVVAATTTTEDIVLARDGSLSGTVTGEGGAPLTGIEVEVCGGQVFECFTTTTEAAGHYSFAELSEGDYSESATPPSHSGYTVTQTQNPVHVTPTQNTTENVSLTEVGGVHGTVTGAANAGLANVSVNACGPTACYQATTDANGDYSIAEAADGTYIATATPPAHGGYEAASVEFAVSGKTSALANFALLEAGEVSGTVSYEGNPVASAYVEVCDTGCYAAFTDAEGEYSASEVPGGEYVVDVYPPAPYSQGISPQFTVTPHGHTTQNVALTRPKPLPNGTIVNGISETVVNGVTVPVIEWAFESPVTTKGCVGGKVTVTITAPYYGSGVTEVTGPIPLTETAPSSGMFSGKIPPVYPKHGEGKIIIKVEGCANSGEELTAESTIYIDPSGVVEDANNGDAPVAGATVTLLSGELEAGPFTAVPNGSAVMSPANRTNPGITGANGEFGWDTVTGFYEVEAKKEGCGTTTTGAFEVPPPQTNLVLKLHCLLKVETSSLSKAVVGSPYEATLAVSGGVAPYKWKKTSKLPKGLKLGKTGVISGTPNKKVVPGFYKVGVEVKDAKKHSASAELTLHIS